MRGNIVSLTKTLILRQARKEDASVLANLINIAGEGIPEYFWQMSACKNKSAMDIGVERASRDEGGFSYRNAVVASIGDRVAGMILMYPLSYPTESEIKQLEELPEVIRPMVKLEYMVPGTFYINALAVHEEWRNFGVGSELLAFAEARAKTTGFNVLSIQVFSQNIGAVSLYKRHGYVESGRLPVLSHPCPPFYNEDILLLTKRIN